MTKLNHSWAGKMVYAAIDSIQKSDWDKLQELGCWKVGGSINNDEDLHVIASPFSICWKGSLPLEEYLKELGFSEDFKELMKELTVSEYDWIFIDQASSQTREEYYGETK